MIGDKRRTFRMTVATCRTSALLEVGNRRYKVVLTDESAGGFCVVSRHPVPCEVHQTVWLQTDRGRFETRVVYQQPLLGQTRIGLEVLSEITIPRSPSHLSQFALFLIVALASLVLFRAVLH